MELCTPAVVYLFFSIVIVVVDFFSRQFGVAFGKLIVTFIVTYLLDILCKKGYEILSWIFVLLPFIYMIYIMTILFLTFKLVNNTTQQQQPQPQPPQLHPSVVHVNVVPQPTRGNNVYLIKTN